MSNIDLDVASPEQVIAVLRRAIDQFQGSAYELASAWQDRSAGKPWELIASEIERAADRIEAKLTKAVA